MFIPTNFNGKLIYSYDVNSLYPYIMKNYLMSIGKKNILKVILEK